MRNEARHTHRYSYVDYLGFEGDTRWELIDGEAHAMAPAPTTRHQRIAQNLAVLSFHCFRGTPCGPFIAQLSDFEVVQPDGLVVCDRTKIGEAAIVGTPDVVIEILRPRPKRAIDGRNARCTSVSVSRNTGSFLKVASWRCTSMSRVVTRRLPSPASTNRSRARASRKSA
ncbi:MAG: Uma2 family endonuclease [Pseudomonadota bacterium]|nr:Uma2 family endonuclease [Pseudomonadota bacterium]